MKNHLSILLLTALLFACGPPAVKQYSPLDTAENHYLQGLVFLDDNQLLQAERAFERARSLDDDYPGSFVGMALVRAHRGDFHEARKQVEEALRRDRQYLDAYVGLGRVITAEGVALGRQRKTWLAEAEDAFKKAERLNNQNMALYWYWGQAYVSANDLPNAKVQFDKILSNGRGPWVEKALVEVENLQKVERGAPGSRLGGDIGLKPSITRAELAVLLVEELKLPELVAKRGRPSASQNVMLPTDVETSWARAWINSTLQLGIHGLEVYPDGNFYPDNHLTRAQYAQVGQSILILLSGDRNLSTRYIGEESRFPDVRSDFYAYNAIVLCLERGLLKIADRRTGTVEPNGTVSGADVLLAIRELQNAFRMED